MTGQSAPRRALAVTRQRSLREEHSPGCCPRQLTRAELNCPHQVLMLRENYRTEQSSDATLQRPPPVPCPPTSLPQRVQIDQRRVTPLPQNLRRLACTRVTTAEAAVEVYVLERCTCAPRLRPAKLCQL